VSDDTDLSLEGVDPVTFQIIKHRLVRVTDEAVEALKRVSGSPTTNEGHDLMVALYTKEGDLLTGGVGFLHHYVGASEATKHVIDRFEGDIEEGDAFLLNDPYTAALHPPDVYIISPIFHKGELRAFTANFVHVGDIGAIDPGGFAPSSRSIHHEGFQTPGIKLRSNGEVNQDVLDTVLNMSRDPGRLELDFRSQIAANNVATDRMQELMDEYGPGTVERVGEALIDQSSERFRARLLNLPDGEFEERQYIESAPEDEVYTVKVTLRKESDSLTFDFEGTDEQSDVGINCTDVGTLGGVLAPVLPLMCQDMTWNDGIIRHVDIEAPTGTLVNAERPAPVSIATVATLQVCNNLSTLAVSKLQGSTDEYLDRATGVWHGAHCGVGLEMRTADETRVDMITDTFAGAGGGRGGSDGVDLGGEVTNVVTRWANVERHESTQPLMFLGRKFVPDSGGAGRNRGGVCHEYAVTPVEGLGYEDVIARITGRGTEVPQSTGVFGGYPGCTIEFSLFRGSNHGGNTAFPDTVDPDVETDEVTWGNHSIGFDDALYVRAPGSGGYGDPLSRDPDRVRADVARGAVTPETARRVYGVPVTENGDPDGDVDTARERIYETRREAADDFRPPVSTAEDDLVETDRRYGDGATVVRERDSGETYVVCADCETPIAAMDPGWKSQMAVRERPVAEAGIHRDCPDDLELREFSCPGCGNLIDAEVAFASDPYLTTVLD